MATTCAACHDPLLVEIESDSEAEDSKLPAAHESVPDDVELGCGCHFHWECFLDAYAITQCPNCGKEISSMSGTGQQQVLCTVRNEGGVQEAFDILPTATEEAYLRAYPEERRGHAFLQFCREGDLDAIIHLMREDEDDEPTPGDEVDILRYQGTFEGIEGSGLHVAIRYQREEVAWLMLAMASALDWSKFPQPVLDAMQNLGLSKDGRKPSPDVRTLKDESGRTPQAVAQEVGGPWSKWLAEGLLQV